MGTCSKIHVPEVEGNTRFPGNLASTSWRYKFFIPNPPNMVNLYTAEVPGRLLGTFQSTMSTRQKRGMFRYGPPNKRARNQPIGRPMFGRNSGPGRGGFKSNFFRLQRAPGLSRELGYVDVASASYALDTTGSVTLLNTVAQGAAVTQRVGKKIAMKGLQCRGNILANSATTIADGAILIVYDKRPTGALPTITDILVSANTNSMNNDANAGRFSILKRVDQVVIGNSTTPATGAEAFDADWWLDLKGREVVYKAAATGAIGDIEQGALYLVTIGGNAAGTGAATFAAGFRMRFLDI